jgi:LysR family nitrogen assimilation transcriptional regulator
VAAFSGLPVSLDLVTQDSFVELRQLANFIQVVETGSFVRAAALTNLSQPTLSREIASLEEEFGERLLIRTGRGVLPTEAGLALVAHARAMLELADRTREAMYELHASPRGKLTIGLPPSIARDLASPLVIRFIELFPEATLSIVEGPTVNLREWLIAGRIDVALLFDPPASPQLDYQVLKHEDLVMIIPSSYSDVPASIGIRDLQKFPLLLPAPSNAIRDLVDTSTRAIGVRLVPIAEVNGASILKSLVEGGTGCAILPRSLAVTTASARIRIVEIGWPPITNTLVLAQPKARPTTRLIRAGVALLHELGYPTFSEDGMKPHMPVSARTD